MGMAGAPLPLPASSDGSVIRFKNEFISSNAPVCAPVAASPESWVSAFVKADPVKPYSVVNEAGSVAPFATALSIPVATLVGFTGAPGGNCGTRAVLQVDD